MSGSWGIGRDILVSARASDAAVDVQTMPAPAQEPLKVASGLLRRSAGVGRKVATLRHPCAQARAGASGSTASSTSAAITPVQMLRGSKKPDEAWISAPVCKTIRGLLGSIVALT